MFATREQVVKIVENFGRYVAERADEIVGSYDRLTEYEIVLRCSVDLALPQIEVRKVQHCTDALNGIFGKR